MADVYQLITDRIVEQLEEGTVPWRKPWKAGPHGWPKNLARNHVYRGINVFLLSSTPFELPYWLTFKQAKKLGGHVRKGERSTVVVFWKWLEKDGINPETGEKETAKIPLLRYYNVFNVAQCEGLDERIPQVDEPAEPFEPIAECERVVADMPQAPGVRHGLNGAFYDPSADFVGMPSPERFDRPEEYYSTLFHELTHATGHKSRLDRSGIADGAYRFGSPTYSKEELVAEMGAAFLCGQTGIETTVLDNSAAYIASWLKRLKDDKRLVVHAAANAQKAADFILGCSAETA